jgi:LPXTG-motif cell wall-anchored protein
VILTAKAPNRRRSLRPFGGRDDAGPRSRNTGREKMDTTTLLVIVFVVLLLGGGGFFYSRRV